MRNCFQLNETGRAICLFGAVLLFGVDRLAAQEFSVQAGKMETLEGGGSSYSWQLDYRQHLSRHLAFSAAWINEGHVADHHRDGLALEGWVKLPLLRNRLELSAGAGAYRYFDTERLALDGSANVHGWAPIYSLSATYYAKSPWFLRLSANRIHPSDDIATNTLVLGAGYVLGGGSRRGSSVESPGGGPEVDPPNEVTLFLGQSVVNTFVSESALAKGLEYRRGLSEHWDWTLTLINEGDPKIIRRNGVGSQFWLMSGDLGSRLSVGLGIGAYVYVDRKRPPVGGRDSNHAVAGLVSPALTYGLGDHWHARLVWNRIVSDYNRDADVFLLGLGYRWGR